MSAIARYFHAQGKVVKGYDKTQTQLTSKLEKEGIDVHYEDLGFKALQGLSVDNTLVVYTPAIPSKHKELNAFRDDEFLVIKRAKALGIISAEFETFAVAGTHGKTTTSSILTHVLNHSNEGCNAFIGGISSNYNSNCIINSNSSRVVVEADEFDRSFLQLSPNHAIVTSMDADHLDIYGSGDHLKDSFRDFMRLADSDGKLIVNSSLDVSGFNLGREVITYGFDDESADWVGSNIRYDQGKFYFDVKKGDQHWQDVEFGLPGIHNAENALAVFALCTTLGLGEELIRETFQSYLGVKRRFDFKIRNEELVYIDDYAHHPTEITSFLSSVRKLYPNKKITTVFQPHLFSRTRDFMDGFAESLSMSDELFLLDIYPARELPIDGITSDVLLDKVTIANKQMSSKEQIVADLKLSGKEVIVTVGAGDIDTCVEPITKAYS
ncbi:MAG: UDP-N-acetylmuramate--L-alanine ligase [Flavobacteriales bacterium]|nr:UDP-N-acetylmuramate--L-alanine ligase [Flavobacteriales bacterium]